MTETPRPLRVLEVFEPPDGGVARAVLQLADGLGGQGVSVEVAGPRDSGSYATLESAGVPITRLPFDRGYGHPSREGHALAAILRRLRRGRIDVVHAHAAKAGMLARVAGAITGTPVVYSPHCLPFVGELSRRRQGVSLGLEHLAARMTSAVICVCEDERRIALAHNLISAERAYVVLNGVPDAEPGAPDPRLVRLRGRDGLLVGAVSVLREQKGLLDLISATPDILARVPRARMAIIGDGPSGPALREAASAAQLDDEPRFGLFTYEGPAARHLRALDVYVLPSLWEAMPFAPLEAMAHGVPQVVTDVGGTPEAVTSDTGILVAPHDPDALARAIGDLLVDDERRAALARGSVERHARCFRAERMLAETAAVYRSVAAGSFPPDPVNGAASTAGARPAML